MTLPSVFLGDDADELSQAECEALLAGAHVGHVSVNIDALPAVVPVDYGYLGGNVILLMPGGPALRAIAQGGVIGFAVDNADLTEDAFWTVLVIGRADEITDAALCAEYRRAGLITHPRVGGRLHYLRLTPEIMTGYLG